MAGGMQDRGTFRGIAATLLSLALLAERAAGRSLPVRFVVLAILGRAEAIARGFVARSTAASIAEAIEAGCPDVPFPDLACLEEPHGLHYGAADAVLLALRLRVLAAVLGALAGADGASDDLACGWTTDGVAVPTLDAAGVPHLTALFLFVRLPAGHRLLRPPDTS
ncbi:hypothetical protein RHIZO_04571 [Rhizobiaceae bacterium]|nr:hypothetical protein RHIZO_04571 [Rhizobiaceae bacterium]